MAKVRLIDIAKNAGVSVGTVSLILNQKAEQIRISSDLIKKVTDVANALGYVPNQIAVSLRTGQTKVICLVVEDFANPFFAEITSLVEARLREKGYQLVCSSIANDPQSTTKLIKKLSNGLVDGFLITPMPGIKKDIQMLVEMGMPIVLIDSNYPDLPTSHVLTDNEKGVGLGMQHFFKMGYKKILFASLDYDMIQIRQRENSYGFCMNEEGYKPKIVRLKYRDIDNTNHETLKKALRSYKPDGVFFATNYLCIQGLESIRDLDLRIPEDIGVMCFDEHNLFKLYSPGITAIAQPIEKIVDSAVGIMINKLHSKQLGKIESVEMLPKLIVRKSLIKS